jgi:hypothetical protein
MRGVALALLMLAACRAREPAFVVGESSRGAIAREDNLVRGGTLRLRGARGEVLGVRVIAGAGAISLPREIASVNGFRVGDVDVREPSTSLYGPSSGKGVYPDTLTPTNAAADFFDVKISANAAPGKYAGTLALGDKTIPCELVVEPITIDITRDPLVWVFYLPSEIARAEMLADDDGAAELAAELRYAQLFREHGAFLAADLPPARYAPRRPLLAGLRFLPIAVRVASDEDTKADLAAWHTLLANVAAIPFAIPVDEPHSLDTWARAQHVAQLIHANEKKILVGVTAPYHADLASDFDLFIASSPHGRYRFTYNGKPPQAGSMIIDTEGVALRTWGVIAFRYHIDLWYAWEGLYFRDRYNGGDAMDLVNTFDERRAKHEPDGDHGNGDGLLAYPGALPSLRLKALRRGLQDRLLLQKIAACGDTQDADAIAHALVPVALDDAKGKGQGAWPHDEAAWERARNQLLDALVLHCKP